MRVALTICLLSATLLLFSCSGQEENKLPPQFTWEAFQRFWSKRATPFVTLNGTLQTEAGYILDYGHAVLLHIKMKNKIVTGVEVVLSNQNNLGGQQFLRLVDQIMDVGVFRWTGAEIATMRNFFGPMGVTQKEFSYKNSHFIRRLEGNSWYFELIFIANSNEVWSNIPLDALTP